MIKPFTQIELDHYFRNDLEKIMMAYRLSDSVKKQALNIKAAGNEVEIAVRDFFKDKLFPKYHVGDGHIVDESLKIGPQCDVIISENVKNPILFNLADGTEFVYYETVYAYGEVKRSFYDKNLIDNFSTNLERFNAEMKREGIPPDFVECAQSGFHVGEPLTKLPRRNPMFSFMFFVDSSNLKSSDINKLFKPENNKNLPNMTVFLDKGLLINLNKNDYDQGTITINLYPEYEAEDNIWAIYELPDRNKVLIYQYMLLLEHLNGTILSYPDIKTYTQKLFNTSKLNIHLL